MFNSIVKEMKSDCGVTKADSAARYSPIARDVMLWSGDASRFVLSTCGAAFSNPNDPSDVPQTHEVGQVSDEIVGERKLSVIRGMAGALG